MRVKHTPKIDLSRGVSLVYYCKCGTAAYMDVGSGKVQHAERLPERLISERSIGASMEQHEHYGHDALPGRRRGR